MHGLGLHRDKELRDRESVFNRVQPPAEPRPGSIDEVFKDGWISTAQMRDLYKNFIQKEKPFAVAISQSIEDPVGLGSPWTQCDPWGRH